MKIWYTQICMCTYNCVKRILVAFQRAFMAFEFDLIYKIIIIIIDAASKISMSHIFILLCGISLHHNNISSVCFLSLTVMALIGSF